MNDSEQEQFPGGRNPAACASAWQRAARSRAGQGGAVKYIISPMVRPLNAPASERARIRRAIRASAATVSSLSTQADAISGMAGMVVRALKAGRKVLTAGNGGSAAEALHMAEELTGRFRENRRSLPGIALVADATALTCIGNDFGFDEIFSRQIEGLGERGDVLVLFSTSGRARNLDRAMEAGRTKGMRILSLLGRDGGKLAGRSDVEILVEGTATERIQEAHQVVLHLILDVVERAFEVPRLSLKGPARR
jgi:D-sedoheptulose 7-phosphate isomerase